MLYTWKFVINQCYFNEKKIVYVNGFSLLLTKIQIPYHGLSNGCSGLILLHSPLDHSSHLPSISSMKVLSSGQVFPFLRQFPPSPGWVPPHSRDFRLIHVLSGCLLQCWPLLYSTTASSSSSSPRCEK